MPDLGIAAPMSNLTDSNSSTSRRLHLKVRIVTLSSYQLFLDCLYIYNNYTLLVRLTQTYKTFKFLKWMFACGKISL